MNKNKKMKKTIKYALIILIIIAIIVVIALYQSNKETEVTLNNLPETQYTEEEAEEIFSKLDGTLLPLDKSQKAKVESFFNISGMKTMEFQRNGAALRIIFSDGRTSYIFMFHPEDGAIICEEREDTIALILNKDAILLVLNDSDILEVPLQ